MKKKMMKLISVFLLALLLAAILCSCQVREESRTQELEVRDESNFTFAVCGDPHGNYQIFGKIVEAAKQLQFLVVVGDLTKSGSEMEYRKLHDFLEGSGVSYYLIRGDNDREKDPQGINFIKYFGPLYRSFNYQNSHFLLLDNSDGFNGFSDEELRWIEDDLGENSSRHIFAFAHIPPGAPPGLGVPYNMWEKARISGERALEILQRFQVELMFCGHIHGYEEYQAESPRILVTGGAGATLHLPEQIGGYYHYLKAHVKGEVVEVEVVRI